MLAFAALFVYIHSIAAVLIQVCSSQNLGTNFASYDFMSNGWCSDRCRAAGYAAAITQNYGCWCSNTVPSDTVPINTCNSRCPGFSELCGGEGVYGYIIIGSVSTASPSSSLTSIPLSASSVSSLPSPMVDTSRSSPQTTALTTQMHSSTAPSSPQQMTETSLTAQTQSAPPTSSTTQAVQTSQISQQNEQASQSQQSFLATSMNAAALVSNQTLGGSSSELVSTKYVTEVASATSSTNRADQNQPSFFDSKGKVAGTFTAVGVVVIAFLATLIYCCCFCGRYHRDDYSDEENQYSSNKSFVAPEKRPHARGCSDHSKASLTNLHGNMNYSNSSKSILSLPNATNAGSGCAGTATVNRSSSKGKLNLRNDNLDLGGPTMFPISKFDNLLDESKIFMNLNQSRPSFADENDYSRRILQVTNP